MPKRSNPWPAFVDLFACLLIGTFAGYILLASANKTHLNKIKGIGAELDECRRAKDIKTELQQKIEELSASLLQNLRSSGIVMKSRPCGEDICVDLDINFAVSSDRIPPQQIEVLHDTAKGIREALMNLKKADRDLVEVVIEGHTDNQQPLRLDDPRERDIYNWVLSGRRAVSVLYEFSSKGIRFPEFQILAVGFADSRPICEPKERVECQNKNRRTTLRFKVRSEEIDKKGKSSVRMDLGGAKPLGTLLTGGVLVMNSITDEPPAPAPAPDPVPVPVPAPVPVPVPVPTPAPKRLTNGVSENWRQNLLILVRQQIRDGKYDEAIDTSKSILKQIPQDRDAVNLLAEASRLKYK